MRRPVIIRHLGMILLFNSFFLFVSAIISGILRESSFIPLLYSALISVIFGVFPLIYIEQPENLQYKEGIFIVVSGWVASCIIGMLPFLMWGGEFTIVNAWFESVSGYTTTGSSILTEVEAIPTGLLFWRSSTHWLGGIGVILFALLIFPRSSSSRQKLIRSELSEMSKQSFRTKTSDILKIILYVYIGLTLLEVISLFLAGMSLFDAITHSFATIATGGFSPKNASIAHFNSVTIEVIIMIFMVLSGIHFGLHFATLTGKKYNIFTSSVVRYYLIFLFSGVFLVTLKLYLSDFGDWSESLRYASFQVISLGTTTGFATTDTAAWPAFSQLILIYFSIQCACIGSTSGGLKFDRILMLFKSIKKQVQIFLHPQAVIVKKIDKIKITHEMEQFFLTFTLVYLIVILISSLINSFLGMDLMTAFSASVATIGNVGPGFGNVSSLGNYADIPNLSKFILTIVMLMGRLEIFSILSFLYIRSWK
ncbi:MAG: potassium transporter TrkG [Bacteroidales bacterium]